MLSYSIDITVANNILHILCIDQTEQKLTFPDRDHKLHTIQFDCRILANFIYSYGNKPVQITHTLHKPICSYCSCNIIKSLPCPFLLCIELVIRQNDQKTINIEAVPFLDFLFQSVVITIALVGCFECCPMSTLCRMFC